MFLGVLVFQESDSGMRGGRTAEGETKDEEVECETRSKGDRKAPRGMPGDKRGAEGEGVVRNRVKERRGRERERVTADRRAKPRGYGVYKCSACRDER